MQETVVLFTHSTAQIKPVNNNHLGVNIVYGDRTHGLFV